MNSRRNGTSDIAAQIEEGGCLLCSRSGEIVKSNCLIARDQQRCFGGPYEAQGRVFCTLLPSNCLIDHLHFPMLASLPLLSRNLPLNAERPRGSPSGAGFGQQW